MRVTGRVTVQGDPATQGRLTLAPKGEGELAFGVIAQDGAFDLRSADVMGVMPGEYRVKFRQKPEGKLLRVMSKQLERVAPVEEIAVSYSSPDEEVITITEAGVEDLAIDIDTKKGWKRNINK